MMNGVSEASCASLPGAREGKRVRSVEAAPPTSLLNGGHNGTSQSFFLYPSSFSSFLSVVLGLPRSPSPSRTLRTYASHACLHDAPRPIWPPREKLALLIISLTRRSRPHVPHPVERAYYVLAAEKLHKQT